jgi:hypothetical protein
MSIDTAMRQSRRALLGGAIGGLAALVANALGRPAIVAAHDPDDVRLGTDNSTAGFTIVQCTTEGGNGFQGTAHGDGSWGLVGNSDTGVGVYGLGGTGTGVYGTTGDGGNSVVGEKTTAGSAVWGNIKSSTSTDGAVVGTTIGHGPGVRGVNNSDGRGTWGKALGTGEGVYGESALGRGGLFVGKKAQIRLAPSTATTHPSSGSAGDIFVDASKRVWFCKGGSTWVRLDT